MKKAIPFLIFFQLISCGFTDYVTPGELNELLSTENPLIIDLRSPKKFADGHIRGAVNIEYHEATFKRDLEGIYKGRNIVIYCGEGIKSDSAAEVMKGQGFGQVKILKGGYSNWLGKGFKGEK